MRRFSCTVVFVLLAALCGGPPAFAARFDSVQLAIIEGRWDRAEAEAGLLDTASESGDFYSLYVTAARAMGEGRCTESQTLAQVLLAARPGFLPARELIAICQARQGNMALANSQLAQLLATLPEGPQRDVIEHMLASQRAANGPSVSANFEIRPSTNIGRQTSAADFEGIPLPDENRARSGFELTGGVAVTQDVLSNDVFRLAGVLRANVNWSSADHLLRPSLTLETPMTFSHADAQLVLTPFATLGLADGERDVTRYGAKAALSVALTPQWTAGWGGSLARSTHELEPVRNGVILDNTISLSYLVSPETRMTGFASVRALLADAAARGTQELSMALRIDHIWENGLMTGLQGKIGRKDYNRPANWFSSENQQDVYYGARLELSHRDLVFSPLPGTNVRPSVFYEFVDQRSDSVFYTYRSHDLGASLRVAF